MKTLTIRYAATAVIAALATITFSACGSDDDDPVPTAARYTITLTNLTANQPLAPAAAVLHDGGYAGWQAGQPASTGLEVLAESGSPADLTAEADADAAVIASASGPGVVAPGANSDITLEGIVGGTAELEVAAMLVNTNDAFAGTSGLNLASLQVGDELTAALVPYDAGTEVNEETAATVPGPAGGGEGFNAADGEGFVAVHSGVVSSADGLASSALVESHRFQSPVARVRVVRTQ